MMHYFFKIQNLFHDFFWSTTLSLQTWGVLKIQIDVLYIYYLGESMSESMKLVRTNRFIRFKRSYHLSIECCFVFVRLLLLLRHPSNHFYFQWLLGTPQKRTSGKIRLLLRDQHPVRLASISFMLILLLQVKIRMIFIQYFMILYLTMYYYMCSHHQNHQQ